MENYQNSNAWYEKKWLVYLLCLFLFPVGLYALWKNSTISKAVKIIITAIITVFVLSKIAGDGDKTKETAANTSNKTEEKESSVEPAKEKQWVTIQELSGTGMKKSPLFELTGSESRIKYKYKSEDAAGMDLGMFAVYIVDEGDELIKQGGIPEVMSTASEEETEAALQKGSGKYYIDVQASGKWTVEIQELK